MKNTNISGRENLWRGRIINTFQCSFEMSYCNTFL